MFSDENVVSVENLIGKTITNIVGVVEDSDEIVITCSDNTSYKMYHYQDCCEYVRVDNIEGDINNIINSVIIFASEDHPDRPVLDSESFTWTDYRIQTEKGTVIFQWLGCSNGYYGEEPRIEKIINE